MESPTIVKWNVASVISFGTAFASVYLAGLAYFGCHTVRECPVDHFPTISNFARYRYFDRSYTFMLTILCYSSLSYGVRANYYKFANILSPAVNTTLLTMGIIGLLPTP